jgi:hypothetical protein
MLILISACKVVLIDKMYLQGRIQGGGGGGGGAPGARPP